MVRWHSVWLTNCYWESQSVSSGWGSQSPPVYRGDNCCEWLRLIQGAPRLLQIQIQSPGSFENLRRVFQPPELPLGWKGRSISRLATAGLYHLGFLIASAPNQ